mgnify:CR=1 FL=1
MKGCKQIRLEDFKKLWKNKKVLEELEEKELWEEILKEYWKKCGKNKGSISWKDLGDRVFSEYDRLYYSDNKWYCKCISCRDKMKWNDRKCQCGHYVSRWVLRYRYDIRNCYPQCYRCNVILNGNYRSYTIKMIDMLWKEEVEEMINNKKVVDLKKSWYEEKIIEWYKFIKIKKKKLWIVEYM